MKARELHATCPLCDKSFATDRGVVTHLRHKHTDAFYKCGNCGMEFRDNKPNADNYKAWKEHRCKQ